MDDNTVDDDWTTRLHEQLDWQWREALRPRLAGLTDDEYFWEPAPGCWTVRPRGERPAVEYPGAFGCGGGAFTTDFAFPEPDPPPVTTIAWRLAHLIVGVFGYRAAAHFGSKVAPGADAIAAYREFAYAGSAAEALEQLDAVYADWSAGVRALDAAALRRPIGPAEEEWAKFPMADLVLHINREALHHGAEVALLRDLYRARAR
jgi:DinB family protein